MNRVWIIMMLAGGLPAAASVQRPLQVYLPQEVRLEGDTVHLGQVAILLGDTQLAQKARDVSLGGFAMEGQTLLVDRNTLLSRLASSGIRAHQVQIRGAETVQIKRHEMTLSADRIVTFARRYLETVITAQKGTEATLLRPPKPRIFNADAGPIELTVKEDIQQSGGVRMIRVAILQDGREAGVEEVVFGVRYSVRRVVAAAELPAGTMLTSENVRVETVPGDRPEPDGWAVPYGMVTRQRIAEGAAVSEAVLESRQEPVLIRRRQNVLVRIDTGVLFVSASGEAMDEGRVGDIIRVRRGQRPDERIINCRVLPDGSLEPAL